MTIDQVSNNQGQVMKCVDENGKTPDLAGVVFAWNFQSAYYNRQIVLDELEKAGIKLKFNNISKENIFKRAIDSRKGKSFNGRKLKVEMVKSDSGQEIYQYFISKTVGEDLEFELLDKVYFDKLSDRVICSNSDVEQLIADGMRFHYAHFDNSDLHTFSKRIFKQFKTIPWRPNGGVYFVPAHHMKEVEQFIKFYLAIEKKAHFSYTEVPSTILARKTIEVAYRDVLESQLEKNVKEFKDLMSEKSEMSKEIFDNRMEKFSGMLGDLKMYKEITKSNLEQSDALIHIFSIATQYFRINDKIHPLISYFEDERFNHTELLSIMRRWNEDLEKKFLTIDMENIYNYEDLCIALEIEPYPQEA